MKRVTSQEFSMKRIRVLLFALAMLGIGGIGAVGVNAQDSGQPLDLPCVTGATILPLAQASPTDAPDYALSLLQLTIAPGGGFTAHTHPPTLLVSVVSGNFGITPREHDMSVMKDGAEVKVAKGEEVELHAGDWIVERGMIHSMRALGDEPVVVLISGYTEADQALVQCVEGTPTP
jgi:quercetin dioxygenase-like cupin family protein